MSTPATFNTSAFSPSQQDEIARIVARAETNGRNSTLIRQLQEKPILTGALPTGKPEGFQGWYSLNGRAHLLTYLPSINGTTYPWSVSGPGITYAHGSASPVTVPTLTSIGSTFSVPLSGVYDYYLTAALLRQNASVASFMAIRVDNTVPTTIINAVEQTTGSDGSPVSVQVPGVTLLSTDILQAKYQMVSGTNADFFVIASTLNPVRVG